MKSQIKRKILCLFLLPVILLTACGQKQPVQTEAESRPVQTSAEMTAEAAEPTAGSVQATTEPEVTAPEQLSAMLEANGLCLQDLEALGCRQLVTVDAEGTSAQIDLYVLADYQWQRQETVSCSGYVGKNGTTAQKCEGDKATPKGLYPIAEAFYMAEAPQTGLPVFQITADTYWVDDPKSEFYNQRVEGTENKDWTSAEQMYRYSTSYEYGFVIGYNTEGTPNAGSAIFFHVGDHPTAGCIATGRAFVLEYLALLREEPEPYILID